MKYLYFVTFELRSLTLRTIEMCELTLDRPVRSFGDIVGMAEIIKNNFKEKVGECVITILNYQRLEEETRYEKKEEPEVY